MNRIIAIKMLRDFIVPTEDVCSVTTVPCDCPNCSNHVCIQATSRQT